MNPSTHLTFNLPIFNRNPTTLLMCNRHVWKTFARGPQEFKNHLGSIFLVKALGTPPAFQIGYVFIQKGVFFPRFFRRNLPLVGHAFLKAERRAAVNYCNSMCVTDHDQSDSETDVGAVDEDTSIVSGLKDLGELL